MALFAEHAQFKNKVFEIYNLGTPIKIVCSKIDRINEASYVYSFN